MNLLEGEKIRLRAVEPEDLDLLMEWENNPENWTISGTINPFSKSLMSSYIENAHLNIYQAGQYRFMIVSKASEKCIGTMDIFDFDAFHKRAGLGILIGDQHQRGLGFAKEAMNLIIDYCFHHLDLHQLFCNILEDNSRSIKLFESSGFLPVGIKKDWIRVNSEFKNEIMLQLLKKVDD